MNRFGRCLAHLITTKCVKMFMDYINVLYKTGFTCINVTENINFRATFKRRLQV